MMVPALLAFIGFMLAVSARDSLRSRGARYLVFGKQARLPFLRALVLLVAVVGVSGALHASGGLWQWSWLNLLDAKGSLVAGTAAPVEADVHPLYWIAPLVFPLLLLAAMPLLVLREEAMFRRGAENDTRFGALRRAVLFGAAHLLVGVPLAVVPGLTLAGVAFGHEYRRAYAQRRSRSYALTASARLHLAYNFVAVGLVLFLLPLLLMQRLSS